MSDPQAGLRAPGAPFPRILFLGSPAFALPALRALHAQERIIGVVTQPDKPSGRGRRIAAPPVAAFARTHGLTLLQPARLRRPEALEPLAALRPDLIVTVAYGKIIPPEVLALPPLGAINAHPSLLPAYRGAAPIQRAIADGCAETGVTIMYQTEELDAGDIILQANTPIGPDETAGELEARLAEVSADLLVRAVELIAAGAAPRRPQGAPTTPYAVKLRKDEGWIDWTQAAPRLANLVRAMNPWPAAFTLRGGRRLTIWRAEPAAEAMGAEPGTVLTVDRGGITVAAGAGALRVTDVQPEGGRRMPADAYARGHRVAPGERWGGSDKIEGGR